jgi:hypothetical protein
MSYLKETYLGKICSMGTVVIGDIVVALRDFCDKSEENIKRDVKFLEKILFCHDIRDDSH